MYELIDCKTDLIYGPFETLAEAQLYAYEYDFNRWEIIITEDRVVDWGGKNETDNELGSR